MAHEIETQWMGKMEFNTAVDGHTIVMDAPERVGGEDHGPLSKPLILSTLSGLHGDGCRSLTVLRDPGLGRRPNRGCPP